MLPCKILAKKNSIEKETMLDISSLVHNMYYPFLFFVKVICIAYTGMEIRQMITFDIKTGKGFRKKCFQKRRKTLHLGDTESENVCGRACNFLLKKNETS